MAHGVHDEVARAEVIIGTAKPTRIVVHHDPAAPAAPDVTPPASRALEKQIA